MNPHPNPPPKSGEGINTRRRMGRLDWILHGHQLAEDRLRTWNEDRDGDPASIRREVALGRQVRDCLLRGDDPEQLPGRAREFYWCMWHHAELQVMRYAREITEAEFRARAKPIREYRKGLTDG